MIKSNSPQLCSARYPLDASKTKSRSVKSTKPSDAKPAINQMEKQVNWIELYKCVRYIYRDAISLNVSTSDEHIPKDVAKSLKDLINRLWEEDWQQLLIRLEVLIRDFVLEARNNLRNLQNVENLPVRYLQGILASYGGFCLAAENFAPFLPQLDKLLMRRFSVDFDLLNKYLFQTCLYSDSFVQNNVPLFMSQAKNVDRELIHSYIIFDEEMADIASRWVDVKKLILKYSKKLTTVDNKGAKLIGDWDSYREHREIASNIMWYTRETTCKNNPEEFDVHLLSLVDDLTTRIPEPEVDKLLKNGEKICKNTCTDILCTCGDCSIKHVLKCGLYTPPMSPTDKISGTNTLNHVQLLQHLNFSTKEKGECVDVSKIKPNVTLPVSSASVTKQSSPKSATFPIKFDAKDKAKHSEEAGKKGPCSKSALVQENLLKLVTDKVITNTLQMNNDRRTKCKTKHDIPNSNMAQINKNKSPTASPTSKVPVISSAPFPNMHSSSTGKNQSITKPAKPEVSNSSCNKARPDVKPAQSGATKCKANSTDCKTINREKEKDAAKTDKKETCTHHCTTSTCEQKQKSIICKKKNSKVCCCVDEQSWTNKSKDNGTNTANCTSSNSKKKTPSPTNSTKDCTGHCCKNCSLFCNDQIGTENKKNNKTLRHCNCAHGEEFETCNTHTKNKFHKMRDRLRNRLNEKRSNALKENNVPKPANENSNDQTNKRKNNKGLKLQTIEPNNIDTNVDTRDIKDLLDFIEGNDNTKKLINAQKKAARKLRQQKLKEEKLREEQELLQMKLEEERLLQELEEAKLKEQAKLKKQAKSKENQTKVKKKNNNNSNNTNNSANNSEKKNPAKAVPEPKTEKPQVQTKTGPMVTIKRVMEGSNKEPTVTITLKGSTPDKDKLLYTLINGQSETSAKQEEKVTEKPVTVKKEEMSKKKKKKAKKEANLKAEIVEPTVSTRIVSQSEIKITKEVVKPIKPPTINNNSNKSSTTNNTSVKDTSVTVSLHNKKDTMLNLQMLRLPPGITITKIDGSTVSRKLNLNAKVSEPAPPPAPTVLQSTDNRSGIIVVDTVKLKQDLPKTEKGTTTPRSKKNKKKRHKKDEPESTVKPPNKSKAPLNEVTNSPIPNILTIKNPMFYQLSENGDSKEEKAKKSPAKPTKQTAATEKNQQASIIKGANGMVTIRSPRLSNGTSPCNSRGIPFMSLHAVGTPVLSELKPVVGPTLNTKTFTPATTEYKKPFNAQEILSGLPGIEITKISKNSIRNKSECKKVFQPADVSIIPTNVTNGTNGDIYKLFYDNSDWSLESVFAPKDIKEDEVLDADELELEAFKRFCQQSVPPERKEKVAYLNVKDIVLKKKGFKQC